MARKKVEFKYIANDSKRRATQKKRKSGMIKKVDEISTLCGVDACAIIYTPDEPRPEVWPSPLGVNRVISRFNEMPVLEQSKKMMSQESFLRQKIQKGQDQLKKLKNENRKKEMNNLMFQSLGGYQSLDNATMIDLNDLAWIIDQNIKEVNKQISKLQGQEGTSNNNNRVATINDEQAQVDNLINSVELKYIANDSKRRATQKKRKSGLIKKVDEISTLCGVDACAIIYSSDDPQPEVWPSPSGVNRVISRFKEMPELEQNKKMMSQESFLRQRIQKGQDQLKKLKNENRKKEMNNLMFQSLGGYQSLDNATMIDLNDLAWIINQNINEVNKQMSKLQGQEGTSSNNNGVATINGEQAQVDNIINGGKVELKYITNDSKRRATLRKRKSGLIKKVDEISTLCGVDACAIIYTSDDPRPEVWPSPSEVNRVISRFKEMPELEQSKKMMSQESFLRQRIQKGQDQLKKLKNENRKKEMNNLMFQSLAGYQSLDNATMIDLNDLAWIIDQNIKEVDKQISKLQGQEGASSNNNGVATINEEQAQVDNLINSGVFPFVDTANNFQNDYRPAPFDP
ncbi:hypothetical protein Ahy_A01g004267 [Arachis hypogaea]|uniref:MADS-box domain-containing protein n=1 Tax=Arachis hypogaea TaxID=3818 RepID=A0A445EVJ5_ARAHY|nr:hypothetical protein Ahy_A01g004267 [Arachis hypogaea]